MIGFGLKWKLTFFFVLCVGIISCCYTHSDPRNCMSSDLPAVACFFNFICPFNDQCLFIILIFFVQLIAVAQKSNLVSLFIGHFG